MKTFKTLVALVVLTMVSLISITLAGMSGLCFMEGDYWGSMVTGVSSLIITVVLVVSFCRARKDRAACNALQTIPADRTYMVLDVKGYILSVYDFGSGGYVETAKAHHPDALAPLMRQLDEEGTRWIVEDLQGNSTDHTCRIHRELLQSITSQEGYSDYLLGNTLPRGITPSRCVVGGEG